MMKKILRSASAVAFLLAVYTIFQLLFSVLGIMAYVVYAIINGDMTRAQLSDLNFRALGADTVMSAYAMDAMALGLLLSSVAMLLFLHLTGFFKFRWNIFRSIKPKPLMLSTLLVFTSMFALNIFVQWFPLENTLETEFSELSHTILGALSISLFGPVLEEVLFRGAIQGYILRKFGKPWLAIVLASLVFGIIHWNPVQVVYATLLGFIFGWLYYRTGSLLSVIVGHVLNNSIATLSELYISNIDEPAITDSSSGVVAFLIFAVLSVLVALKLHRSLPEPPSPWHENGTEPVE